MSLHNLYSKDHFEAIEICKANKIQVPKVNLEPFDELFQKSGLQDIETVAKHLLVNDSKKKEGIQKLIKYFSNNSKAAQKYYDLLTPKSKSIDDASVIFIYGTNKSPARALYGASIYKDQPVPIIISDYQESERYKGVLLENGVPDKQIFEEKEGANFVENAMYSIRLAEEKNIPCTKIILVTASLVALRAVLTTQIFLPKGTEVYSCPVEYDPTNPNDPTSPENWYKDEIGIQIFLSEITKLYILKEEGILGV